MWESIIGLIETLKSPQIRIPPSFLWTTTIGAAHSLHYTGISSTSATCDCMASFTFSFKAKGTGRYLWNFGTADCYIAMVAWVSCNRLNSLFRMSAYSVRKLSGSDGHCSTWCIWIVDWFYNAVRSIPSCWSQSLQNSGCLPVMSTTTKVAFLLCPLNSMLA